MFEQIVTKLKPRNLFNTVLPFLDLEEIVLLTGSRQTGKTSLMYLLADYLNKKKNLDFDQIVWLDMEKITDLTTINSFKDFDEFIDFLKLEKKVNFKKKVFIFIDEVQYIAHASSFLKYLYDKYQTKLKFIVSGSSSLDIKKKFSDRLTGRVVRFSVDPLSFAEFLQFKGKTSDDPQVDYLLEEYLVYGGYPKIALTPEASLKEKLLTEIYSLYVRKDIKDIASIGDVAGFNQLVSLLAMQIGSLVNETELANSSGLSRQTVRNYLFILQNTFVIDVVRPFYQNPRTELLKTPKVYFKDLGLRNAVLDNFSKTAKRTDVGFLAENFIYLQLGHKYKKINFWRTKAKQEVDFVVKEKDKLLAIESKYKFFRKPIIPAGLKAFMRHYQQSQGIVVNKNLTKQSVYQQKSIAFKPIYLV